MNTHLKTSTIILSILLIISISISYFGVFGWLGMVFLNNYFLGIIIAIPVWLITIFSWIAYDSYRTDVLHQPSTITYFLDIDHLA